MNLFFTGTSVPILLLTIFLTLAACLPLSAAESGQVLIKADTVSHDQQEEVVSAKGNVEVQMSGSTLYSDTAAYFMEKGRVTAAGGVRLVKDGDTLSGDIAEFDVEAKTGIVSNGKLFMKKNNQHVSGDRIEKTGEQDYRVKNGTITSCDGDKPVWKFKVDDLKLTVDEFAFGKNAIFYMRDIPVFWLPYIIFPAETERQSGFLMPTAGNSTKKGAFLEIPYYWAISPSQDLTVTADLQSKRGPGAAVEHRYLGLNKGFGKTNAYLIYDTEMAKFRGDIELKQQVDFTQNTYWRANVNYTLDRDYYKDYGTMSGDYNKQYLSTTAFLSHRLDDLLLTGGVNYLDNLDLPDNGSTLQMLPFFTVNGTGRKIPGTPLYYSFATAAINFDRDSGDHGQRLQLFPKLVLPVSSGDLFSGSVWGGYNQRFYSAQTSGAGENGSSQAGLVEAGGELHTDFAKVFAADFGDIDRVRHLVTPQLSYSLTENRGQGDLPFFDYNDRVVGGQLLTFALINTLSGRSSKGGQPQYRDLLRFTVSQSYQLSGGRRDLLVMVDDGRLFTDTQLLLELFPAPSWRLFADTRISPYNGDVTNSVLGFAGGDPKGTTVSVDYTHAENLLDYIAGTITSADFKPFVASATGRYSFDRPGFLETLYSLEYKGQCWGVIFSYQDRLDDKLFSFTVNLSGLGNFKLL